MKYRDLTDGGMEDRDMRRLDRGYIARIPGLEWIELELSIRYK